MNLRLLRTSYGYTQSQLAESIGMTERGYRKIETGTLTGNISSWVALADFYGVSLDYLLGRSADPTFKPVRK